MIAESPVGKLRGQTVINANGETEAKSFIGIFFDTKRSGEASSHPHARTPALKDGRLSKLFSAFFLARNSDTIHESDLFFFFDGMKHHNKNAFTQVFKAPSGEVFGKTERSIKVIYDEDSLATRIERFKGAAVLLQEEHLIMVSANSIKAPRTPRKHHKGSNYGECLGPVTAVDWNGSATWKMEPSQKRNLFGKVGKIPVGGNCADNVVYKKGSDKNVPEPVYWHEQPYTVDEDLVNGFPQCGIVDLIGASPNLCMVAIEQSIPMFAFCFTDYHVTFLRGELEIRVFKKMQDSEDMHNTINCHTSLSNSKI